ncbi:hypothetical protein PBRA_003692 [Plasmodiophora brassicae]|uniref:DUF4211 domain-containing protein n=1 Tax=Plasmodiophora brassicae TaxID=37360 RepID=A0A0G4II82_PLABS|nr:hypothetical protein PBRA_003692 [Plasmodiophora brassicae]
MMAEAVGRGQRTPRRHRIEDDDNDDDDDQVFDARRGTPGSSRRHRSIVCSDDDNDSDDVVIVVNRTPRSARKHPQRTDTDEDGRRPALEGGAAKPNVALNDDEESDCIARRLRHGIDRRQSRPTIVQYLRQKKEDEKRCRSRRQLDFDDDDTSAVCSDESPVRSSAQLHFVDDGCKDKRTPNDDSFVDDNDFIDDDAESEEDPVEFSHRALLFDEEMHDAFKRMITLSEEEAYKGFFIGLVDICVEGRRIARPSEELAYSYRKIVESLRFRARNVRSGAWRQEFEDIVVTNPILSTAPAACGMEGSCEVCHRCGRVARYGIFLSGPRYHPSRIQLSKIGARKAISTGPEHPQSFRSGCFCCERVRLFHAMEHYVAHTTISVKARYNRVHNTHRIPNARSHIADLWREFYDGYSELCQLADQYSGDQSHVSVEMSSSTEALFPSGPEIRHWLPTFFADVCVVKGHE